MIKFCDYKELPDAAFSESEKKTAWFLEEKKEDKKGIYLRGWAFCDGNQHYKYKKKLLLIAEDGSAQSYDVMEEERADVAMSFPKLHYLYDTGFVCCIYKNNLKKETKYKVVLRLSNVFEKDDVQDVVIWKDLWKPLSHMIGNKAGYGED